MYRVGDRVIHPKFGACKIKAVEEKIILGKKQDCLILTPLFDNPNKLIITLPLVNAEKVGLRQPITEEHFEKIEVLFQKTPDSETLHSQITTQVLKEKLTSGQPGKLAEILRDLSIKMTQDGGKYANANRRSMFRRALKLLASELAISKNIPVSEAKSQLEAALNG